MNLPFHVGQKEDPQQSPYLIHSLNVFDAVAVVKFLQAQKATDRTTQPAKQMTKFCPGYRVVQVVGIIPDLESWCVILAACILILTRRGE